MIDPGGGGPSSRSTAGSSGTPSTTPLFDACERRDRGVGEGVNRLHETPSGGLPQLDAIALRIGDPAESTDALHVLRFLDRACSLGAQLREHGIQVADPEVEHGL